VTKSLGAQVAKLEKKPDPPTFLKPDHDAGTGAASSSNDLAQMVAQEPNEVLPILPVLMSPDPHYYRSNELTEKPRLLQDIAPDQVLVLPDIFPQPVVVHLLINELGDIDKVIVEESFLSEQARRLVIEAFTKIKFDPGRLGDMPVKSQLRIEVTLEPLPVRPSLPVP